MNGVPSQLIGELADLILSARPREHWSIDWIEVGRVSPDLAGLVSDISGWPLPTTSVLVHAGRGCLIPEYRSFIEEAIREKQRRYAFQETARLILVIGASSTITLDQIEHYRANCNPTEIRFSEVWVVPAFGEVVPIKR